MSNNKKSTVIYRPLQTETTASWANIEDTKPVSNVPLPSETEVINAKEFVDENEK